MEKLLKVLTDPISNKIIQVIRSNGEMTVADIIAVNTGIPRATIYRKIEKMENLGVIYVSSTNKVRGQIEKVYRIKDIFLTSDGDNKEDMKLVTMSLMAILGQYESYFMSDNADVNRDRLGIYNYNISLNDEDYTSMLKDILSVVDSYQSKQNSETTKLRNIYLLSAPGGEV